MGIYRKRRSRIKRFFFVVIINPDGRCFFLFPCFATTLSKKLGKLKTSTEGRNHFDKNELVCIPQHFLPGFSGHCRGYHESAEDLRRKHFRRNFGTPERHW